MLHCVKIHQIYEISDSQRPTNQLIDSSQPVHCTEIQQLDRLGNFVVCGAQAYHLGEGFWFIDVNWKLLIKYLCLLCISNVVCSGGPKIRSRLGPNSPSERLKTTP